MRRFRFLILLLLGASLVSVAQNRSGSAAPSSSSSSSAASSHSSGGSSSPSAGGSSGSAHSSAGSSRAGAGGSKAGSSTASPNHGSPEGHSNSGPASNADRDRSRTSPSRRVSSENVKAKPGQALPTKVNPPPPTTKTHTWLTRIFHRRRPELAKAPKPCVGKNCPPPPPKPCKGRNCPPPPTCGPGTISNGHGGCVAASQAGNDVCTTTPQAPGCPQSTVQNQNSNCALLQAQLQQAIIEQNRLLQAMNAACATASQGSECISLTQRYNAAESQVELLRQRVRACRP